LADRGEIVGGVRRHVGPMITLAASDCRPAISADDAERKISPRFVALLPYQLLFGHAPVMPEDGCSIVKTEMVSIAGRAQPEVVPALTRPSTLRLVCRCARQPHLAALADHRPRWGVLM
jgi:hypothetical protein